MKKILVAAGMVLYASSMAAAEVKKAENESEYNNFWLHVPATDKPKCRYLHQLLKLRIKEHNVGSAVLKDYQAVIKVFAAIKAFEVRHNDFKVFIEANRSSSWSSSETSDVFQDLLCPDGYADEDFWLHFEGWHKISELEKQFSQLPYKVELMYGRREVEKRRGKFIEQALAKKYD